MEKTADKMERTANKSFIEVFYDVENEWVYANWKGYLNPEEVKQGCELILEVIKDKKARKILNDNTLVNGTWTGAIDWIATDWFPRALNAGFNSLAYIYSPDAFGRFSVNKLLEKNNVYTSNIFKSKDLAEEWLKTV